MAFDAQKTVEALEWNFRPHVDASGTTPEPTAEMVRHFLFESAEIIRGVIAEVEGAENVSDLTEEQYSVIADRQLDCVAELTQGSPTREQIDQLPHRIQRLYVQWLRKELTDPEAPSDATKPSQAQLRSVAPITRPAGS